MMSYRKIYRLKFKGGFSTRDLIRRFPAERDRINDIALLDLPLPSLKVLLPPQKFHRIIRLKRTLGDLPREPDAVWAGNKPVRFLGLIVLLGFMAASLSLSGTPGKVMALPETAAKTFSKNLNGTASWYGEKSRGVGKHTANGERFNEAQKTCASWQFAFDTQLKVTNLQNGKSVICRVNDRGPAKRLRRVIDLSKSAFDDIADLRQGLIRVSITPV